MKLKKGLAAIFVLVFSMAFTTFVNADIAYEPSDSFYEKHYSECSYVNRTYITNSPDGCVVAYSSPGGSAQDVIPNGREFYVSYSWNGEWGCIEYDPDTLSGKYGSRSGWVKLSEMTPEYDSISFSEDHADSISTESVVLQDSLGEDLVVFGYKYPGSGIVVAQLDGYFSEDGMIDLYCSNVYTGADGSRWGYISYYYGLRSFWINLDTPTTQLGPGDEYTEIKTYPVADDDQMQLILRQASPFRPYVIAGIVGVAVIAAAITVCIIIKKKKVN